MNNLGTTPTVKLWQVIAGQIPWFITILSLGAWQASRFESRLGALERATIRIEARQEAAQAEKLDDLRQEVERLRKTRDASH